jgi:ATP-binding cassette, subfamily B, multidrug efflux pump
MNIFRFFESLVRNIDTPPDAGEKGPPPGLLAFYWHFVRQTRWLYFAMLLTGLFVALVDTLIPVFIGKIVGLMAATDRAAALQEESRGLIAMALILLIGKPLMMTIEAIGTCYAKAGRFFRTILRGVLPIV